MLRYTIHFQPSVKENIRSLSPEIKRLVQSALDEIVKNPRSGTLLGGELSGFWKYRAKRYRIIYEIRQDKREILVWIIDMRQIVYQKLEILIPSSR